jgi:dTDP-4-dehydrorhamnose 3,5-epimerase
VDAIAGVVLADLKVIPTGGGPVLHMLRADSPLFSGFGEVYFSEVEPGAVKAWKRHKRMTQHFAVPVGLLKVVLYDDREDSSTRGRVLECLLGRPDNYRLLRIPPMVWYGFTALGSRPALVCNCPDLPHDPGESERIDAADPLVPYRFDAP